MMKIAKGKKDGGDELGAEKEQVLRSKVESLIQKLGNFRLNTLLF